GGRTAAGRLPGLRPGPPPPVPAGHERPAAPGGAHAGPGGVGGRAVLPRDRRSLRGAGAVVERPRDGHPRTRPTVSAGLRPGADLAGSGVRLRPGGRRPGPTGRDVLTVASVRDDLELSQTTPLPPLIGWLQINR